MDQTARLLAVRQRTAAPNRPQTVRPQRKPVGWMGRWWGYVVERIENQRTFWRKSTKKENLARDDKL
jgi:hypothetical protein